LFRVEELLRKEAATSGFNPEVSEEIPILTLFAVEEPENHLSPHYLGRVVNEFAGVAGSGRAQVLVSSHSPSILRRVEPDNVRYFLGNESTSSTRVKDVPLPTDREDEAFKYVREAVRGFPELYFSRLVILGEGPSEEIVLRRLFEASGTPLDTHFISIVPLGGRHVNHFWRLLHGLNIPFLTLLDLDREKEGAGWGRIQYVRDQLVRLHGAGSPMLRTFDQSGKETFSLESEQWNEISNYDITKVDEMNQWIAFLGDHSHIFFSGPLDLDFAMLEAFPEVYKGLAPPPKGPRLPEPDSGDYEAAINRRMLQVLASDADNAAANLGSTYEPRQRKLFAWYKYLFVDRSKPVNHMRALLSIDNAALTANAPETLKSLITRVRGLIGSNGVGG
jgi:predicted ATP-dependent endonuclease of OLD family